ncbi:HTH-type transcriptional regulator VirS [Microbulbifer aggregans]|uniref:HTH-type transcriptional regulator VirS n=1 Tax=Microbulbifer aggregans TaxID=1769779 RepID=A0A1C9W3S1_9GAMM|nr:AraC family transcriptional regulator [Microbulbifer aggregans]AOS95806.1 HTH-type transcriptional regulator VirS [Microbulbifer aggregans]
MTLLIRTSSLSGYPELVRELGGDPDALLRRSRIEPDKVRNLEGFVPLTAQIAALEHAASTLNCPEFGLLLSERQSPLILGPMATIALDAGTVGKALASVTEYMHQYSPGLNLELQPCPETNGARVAFSFDPSLKKTRQALELALGVAQKSLKMVCGPDFRAVALLMRAASPLPHGRYVEHFQTEVRFGSNCDALVLSPEQLASPLNPDSPELQLPKKMFIDNITLDGSLPIIEQVRHLIYELLPAQRCSLLEISGFLGLNKRTLQRRLAEHAIVFEELLDNIRRQLADGYLANSDMPMTQVAGLLGYREQSSFNRACRRWYHCTPLQKRRELTYAAKNREEVIAG